MKGPSDLGTLKEIQQSVKNESERLVVTIAQLLLEEVSKERQRDREMDEWIVNEWTEKQINKTMDWWINR